MLIAVGTYTERVPHCDGHGAGVHLFELGADDGRLTPRGVIGVGACGPNPSYLAHSGGTLYAANEVAEAERSTVTAVRLARTPGDPLIGRVPAGGTACCHLVPLRAGRALGWANYGDGTVGARDIRADGSLGDAPTLQCALGAGVRFPGPNSERQDGSHAHALLELPGGAGAGTGAALLCADLGSDAVWAWRAPAGSADGGAGAGAGEQPAGGWGSQRPVRALAATPGAGPRHLALHPNGEWVYVLNELGASVSACVWDGAASALRRLCADVPLGGRGGEDGEPVALAEGGSAAGAAIRVHPSGRWLYASVRAAHRSFVAQLSVDGRTGALALSGRHARAGATPRDFALAQPAGSGGACYAVVAYQDSDTLAVFRVDEDGHGGGEHGGGEHGGGDGAEAEGAPGRLVAVDGGVASCPSPVCVCVCDPGSGGSAVA